MSLGKALLQWKEPLFVRHAINGSPTLLTDAGKKFITGLMYTAILFGLGLLARLAPRGTPPPLPTLFGICIGTGFFIAFMFPWLFGFIPAFIRISPNGITWSKYKTIDHTASGSIRRCALFRAIVRGQEAMLLRVELNDGTASHFGVAAHIEAAKLIAALRECGMEADDRTRDPAAEWEHRPRLT